MFETTFGCRLADPRGLGDDERRLARLDERDRAVLQLTRREALGVDVGELLELQRALQRDGIADVAAEEAPTRCSAIQCASCSTRSAWSSTVCNFSGTACSSAAAPRARPPW